MSEKKEKVTEKSGGRPKKGQTNNPAGRPKGAKNKSTLVVRNAVALFVEEEIEEVRKAFAQLNARDKVNSFIALLRYAIPPARDVLDDAKKSVVSEIVSKLFDK